MSSDIYKNILIFFLPFLGVGSMVSLLIGELIDKKIFKIIYLITIMLFCIIVFGTLLMNK
ncbi:hypothetical protein [Clostridium sp.]|uniref:hypothetical protein n=1 Tax=Clostridium sp. TaxID=1506 RepID=UPI00261524D3|nr:hypothetical protein [uncultured Clostridium sp.]